MPFAKQLLAEEAILMIDFSLFSWVIQVAESATVPRGENAVIFQSDVYSLWKFYFLENIKLVATLA